MAAIHIDAYTLAVERSCQECGSNYTIAQFAETSEPYFHKPERYIDGCEQICLACWLGVGPNDIDDDAETPVALTDSSPADLPVQVPHKELRDGRFHVNWPYDDVYELMVQGNLVDAYRWFFDAGWHLAVLPITRVKIVNPVFFPNGGAIYPPQVAQLGPLNPHANRRDAEDRAEMCSAPSGIELSTFERLPAIVIPCRFDWDQFVANRHEEHLGLIHTLSELIDRNFLDFMRYWKCRLDSTEALPGRAGQTRDNPRMSGALVFNHSLRESRIVGGAAFTHTITNGLGMPVTQPEWNEMRQDGEVGNVVEHALFLYSNMLEAPSQTAMFMQANAALEYLAFPSEFRPLKKVRAVVVRYSAQSAADHERLTNRFKNDLFGPDGYRTQIVHNGKRLEQLVASQRDRTALFRELDGYIRAMIDDMSHCSEMTWDNYVERRKELGCGDERDDE